MKIDFHIRYKNAFEQYEGYLTDVLKPCTCGSESVTCVFETYSIHLSCNECDEFWHLTRFGTAEPSAAEMVLAIAEYWNREEGETE